jgi:molybdate transport system substrate-binding protein
MRRILAVVATTVTLFALSDTLPASETVTVFAAASLKEALDAQARQFESTTGDKVIVSYAGSNALAKQIEAGAPAAAFISADLDWMDYLDSRKLLTPGSRVNLLRNNLVLIAPAGSRSSLKISPNFALADALGAEKLAMANPDSVPAGKYGKASLEALGVWTSVEKKIARTENVRAALVLVARGEAPFGIVYTTDAQTESGVRIVDTFPDDTHPPIVYPMALLASGTSPAARAFVAYLASAVAQATWVRYGFASARQGAP